jgi:MerR family mercuric resistance operon transcriptional regulator
VQLRLRCARTEYRIGEVAIRAGVSVDAVRYYERLKLLPRARRMSGGFRVFGVESVQRVQFIKQAHELGLTVDEIKDCSRPMERKSV